jgi:hypothetical protein
MTDTANTTKDALTKREAGAGKREDKKAAS